MLSSPRAIRKAVLLGVVGSGKTQLLNAMSKRNLSSIYHPFAKNYQPTIGVDFGILAPNPNIKLQVWDISGNPRFEILSRNYTKTADIFFLTMAPVLNPDLEATLDLNAVFEEQKTYLRSRLAKLDNIKQLNLITTKCDVLEKLSLADKEKWVSLINEFSEQLSKEHELPVTVTYTSALTELSRDPSQEATEDGISQLLQNTGVEKLHSKNTNSSPKHLTEFHLLEKPPLACIHHTMDQVCNTYERLVTKRTFLSTDASRNSTVIALKQAVSNSASVDDIKKALIQAAKDIRTPVNGLRKYGINFFCGFFHYGSYKNSKLYQLIEKELMLLDKNLDLAVLSTPDAQKPPLKATAGVSPAPRVSV